jgi:hypothetical protein
MPEMIPSNAKRARPPLPFCVDGERNHFVTTTDPVMVGWKAQWYAYDPVAVKV